MIIPAIESFIHHPFKTSFHILIIISVQIIVTHLIHHNSNNQFWAMLILMILEGVSLGDWAIAESEIMQGQCQKGIIFSQFKIKFKKLNQPADRIR